MIDKKYKLLSAIKVYKFKTLGRFTRPDHHAGHGFLGMIWIHMRDLDYEQT